MRNTKSVFLSLALLLTVGFGNSVFAQTSDTTPPSDMEKAPTIISVGDGQATLQWEVAVDNVGVTGYKIYYGTTSLADQKNNNASDKKEYDTFKKVDNINQTSITGLTNNTKYYFALTALDAAGNESEYFSPEADATPQVGATTNTNSGNQNSNSATNPGNTNSAGTINTNTNTTIPTGNVPDVSEFKVTESNNTLSFSWKPAAGTSVVDQLLFTSKDNGVTYDSGVHLGSLNSYTMNSFLPNTAYTFKLVAKDATGNESKGVTTTITTTDSNSLPTTKDISNLVAKFERVASYYNVTLTWTLPKDVTDVVSQVVYKSLDGNVFSQLATLTPTVSSYEIKNLAAGKYFFKITTKDKDGKESQGVIKMVELPKSGPALVVVGLVSLLGTGYVMRKKKKV